MERQVSDADETRGLWEYAIAYQGQTYMQRIERDEKHRFVTFIAREIVETVDGEEIDEVEPLWYFTDGNYTTLEEAIEVGDWIIQTGNPR